MSNELIISIKDVDVFRQNHLALSHVNLEVKKGEFIYIIGRVGSGKSSLLKLINAELPIAQGSVQVASYDLVTMLEKEVPFLRRNIGVIYQDFRLLSDRTVFENLKFILQATGWTNMSEMETRIDEVLNQVDIPGKKHNMPHELSGGEQQRVVIARAILNMPQIILADEPTGNLDPMTSRDLMRIFKTLNEQGITIIMATHDYQLIDQHMARIIHIEDKKLFDPQDAVVKD
ncbi:MAG: cell division ATP-binding protein FtsE [Mangrovibacterium sp.]